MLWGAAFVLREKDEVRFDIIYGASARRHAGCSPSSPASRHLLFGISLPAVIDYVTFMKVERTAYLGIRFDWLYSIYVVFAVAASSATAGLTGAPSGQAAGHRSDRRAVGV